MLGDYQQQHSEIDDINKVSYLGHELLTSGFFHSTFLFLLQLSAGKSNLRSETINKRGLHILSIC